MKNDRVYKNASMSLKIH